MHTVTRSALAVSLIAALIGCANQSARQAEKPQPSIVMDDQYEVPPPRTNIPEVMHAKLAHSQAILEGIALNDFVQVEVNARDLRRISLGSEWLIMDTPSYHAYSESFRNVCDDLVNHAREKNLNAISADYANLTNSCVACHSYLRQERQFNDMPGRVSMSGQ